MIGYLLFVFTDFVDSLEYRNYAGFVIIGVIGLNFGGNILLQVIQMCKNLKLGWRRLRHHPLCRKIFPKTPEKAQKYNETQENLNNKLEKFTEEDNPMPWHLDEQPGLTKI
jgi:hypothetical protein